MTQMAFDFGIDTDTAIRPHQWRLDHVELVNWGTFTGFHQIDVGRQGFLLIGPSGSGKSSLIDAISTVLVRTRDRRFNAAAAEGTGRYDRTIASYVRGAWRRQEDEATGAAVSDYLRQGATWSGVLLRFSDGTAAKPWQLVKLFHLNHGAVKPADVSLLCVLLSEPVTLLDFAPFIRDGRKTTQLKKKFPDAFVTDKESAFETRFSHKLGVESENSLILLHKTQSAKSLGSLDNLFRDFMLDEPATFELAKQAVDQYQNLREAHEKVIEAKEQIATLQPLRLQFEQFQTSRTHLIDLEAAREALDPYTESCRETLAQQALTQATEQALLAEQNLTSADAAYDVALDVFQQARIDVDNRGGNTLQLLERASNEAEKRLTQIRIARSRLAEDFSSAMMPMPNTREEFETMRGFLHSGLFVGGTCSAFAGDTPE
jgi:uncharacterized protein YPO0396